MLIVNVPSLKGGRKALGSKGRAEHRARNCNASERIDRVTAFERLGEESCVPSFEDADQRAVAMLQSLQARQHIIGHHRRQRDRDNQACEIEMM